MNKYCESRWTKSRPAYTIRGRKYRRIEELKFLTSSPVNTDNTENKK